MITPAGNSFLPYQPPPQSIGVGLKLLIGLLLHGVDQEGGQDQAQEADVPGRDELLQQATATVRNTELEVIKCHPGRLADSEAKALPAGGGEKITWPLWQTEHFINVFHFPRGRHTHARTDIFRSLLVRVHDSISKLIKAKVRQMFLRLVRLKLDHHFQVVEVQTPDTPSSWLDNKHIGQRQIDIFVW